MRHIVSAAFAAGVLMGAASASTITFQQGSDGYSGCADATIVIGGRGQFDGTNFGAAADLIVNVAHYTPG